MAVNAFTAAPGRRAAVSRIRRIADRVADQAPARPDLVMQVSGPPCAGKSSHIRAHAQAGDLVLDDNQMAARWGGRDRVPGRAWAVWRLHRARIIAGWSGPGRLWFTHGDPTPHSPGVHVLLLDPGRQVCHARADADGRPQVTHQWIDAWYDKHAGSA